MNQAMRAGDERVSECSKTSPFRSIAERRFCSLRLAHARKRGVIPMPAINSEEVAELMRVKPLGYKSPVKPLGQPTRESR